MSTEMKFVVISVLVAGAMGAGFAARRWLGVGEALANRLMWFVVVAGYPSVGLLAVWRIELRAELVWLPVLALVFITSLTFISLGVAKLLTRDRPLVGLFTIAGGLGNTGFTMGAFLCFLFFGPDGLGLAAVHDLAWSVVIVLLIYPMARHYSEVQPLERLGVLGLVWRSIWDVRSMTLLTTLTGLGLNALIGPPQQWLPEGGIVSAMTIMMFLTASLAFFSIGLRLHVSHVLGTMRLIVGLGVVRFLIGPLLGLGIAGLLALSPWSLSEVPLNVFHVETCIPTAVTMVAIANLFHLRPGEASALFVVNTLSYLVICVPVLAAIFG